MNLLQLPPEHREKLRRFHPLVRNIAWVAGCFSALVCIILAWSVWQYHSADPIQASQLPKLIEQIQQGNSDPEFVESVRAYDLMIRRAHFAAQAFIHFGAHLLLGGLAVFLLALKATYELGRIPPEPGAFTPRQEDPGRTGMLQAAILGAALLLGASSLLLPRWFIRPLAVTPSATAPSVPAPGPEQNREQWPSFRGWQSQGLAFGQTPPIDWDLATGRNILWKSEVPKPGFNSPVIWANRVFVSGADEAERVLYGFDLNTGARLWQQSTTVSKPFPMPKVTEDTGLAAPSTATDGRAVAAVFATGEILVTDMEGTLLWEEKLPPAKNHYGHASSLIIHGNNLLVQYDTTQSGGRLYAFDLLTGRRQWVKKREVETSWSSPLIISLAGQEQLILTATPFVAAYDPGSGDLLWQLNEVISGEIGPSPAYDQGRLFFINQYSTLACVDAATHKVLWNVDRNLSDIPSPAARNNLLIVPTSFGKVSCLAAEDGRLLWEERFDAGFNASPVIADNKVYLLDLKGTMHIAELAPEYRPIAAPKVSEDCVATPAFTDSRIVIRTQTKLIVVGAPQP